MIRTNAAPPQIAFWFRLAMEGRFAQKGSFAKRFMMFATIGRSFAALEFAIEDFVRIAERKGRIAES